ncbi:MAG: fasciclin domain-containing protein [Granulosicoccus sp.]
MKRLLYTGFLAACLITAVGCSENSSPDPAINLVVQDEATGNIVETINGEPEFSVFSDAMTRTGLDSMLADTGREYTIFAPTDEAFRGLGETTLSNLFSDADTLSYILSYHVLPDLNVNSTSAAAFSGRSVDAANGVALQVSLAPSRYNANPQAVYINDAEVFVGDVPATNGTIHVVDRVLLPPDVGGTDSDGSTTDGGDADGGNTDGGNTDDGNTDGGNTDGGDAGGGGTDVSATLMDVLAADGDLNTLVDALRRTGLDSLLSDTSRTFTIFAPTDTAFGIYDPFEILLNDTDKLEETLRYHVVADDEIDLNAVSGLSGSRLTMANGDTVFISSFQGSLFLNFYARLDVTDVRATNGIIHKINGVLFTSN